MGSLRCWLAAGIFLAGLLVPVGARLLACSTPVNRYALYRWPPSPYFVFQVRHGKETATDARIRKGFLAAVDSETAPANVELTSVDLAKPESLEQLPREVRRRIEELEETGAENETAAKRARYLIFNPHGGFVYSGRLEPDDVPAMLSSPVRERLAKLLADGKDGVLLFLPGVDAKENERALKETREAIAMVHKEESGAESNEGSQEEPSGQVGLFESDFFDSWDVGLIEVPRDAPPERWLRRFLQSAEELEPAEREKPMVFAAYGRGRIMEPYLGEGIEARNLLSVINFVNGPCSCQVKDQNPGVDLLTSWNWEATALAVAKEVGEETGNEHLLGGGGLLWDLSEVTLPDAEDRDPAAEAQADRPASETVEPTDTVETPPETVEPTGTGTVETPSEAPEATGTVESVETVEALETPAGTVEPVDSTPPAAAGESRPNGWTTGTRDLVIGLGLAVAALLLGAITFVWMRRREI